MCLLFKLNAPQLYPKMFCIIMQISKAQKLSWNTNAFGPIMRRKNILFSQHPCELFSLPRVFRKKKIALLELDLY